MTNASDRINAARLEHLDSLRARVAEAEWDLTTWEEIAQARLDSGDVQGRRAAVTGAEEARRRIEEARRELRHFVADYARRGLTIQIED